MTSKTPHRRRLSNAVTPRLLPLLGLCIIAGALAEDAPRENLPPQFAGPARDARAGRPGPWDNDVLVYRVDPDGAAAQIGTFARAGVPTLARLADGRLIAAHQHFPADFGADFDKVAVRISEDEGRTWTGPQVIQLRGLPEGMRFPFDPTLVPLPDGRIRLYFTSVKGRRIDEHPPAIYSAISRDGISYEFEPGQRFGIDGRIVIDCAVVLHAGIFHLFAPDNGLAGQRRNGNVPSEGVGYHATSEDGLNFKRREDVRIDGRRRWLGNAQSDGKVITFYGTGAGIWTAASKDGFSWTPGASIKARGADPGAVRTSDGGIILIATGPPRR